MVSRISHPNPKVYEVLSMIISKIVSIHPSQALWGLLAVVKSSSPDRATRGASIINKLKVRTISVYLDTVLTVKGSQGTYQVRHTGYRSSCNDHTRPETIRWIAASVRYPHRVQGSKCQLVKGSEFQSQAGTQPACHSDGVDIDSKYTIGPRCTVHSQVCGIRPGQGHNHMYEKFHVSRDCKLTYHSVFR